MALACHITILRTGVLICLKARPRLLSFMYNQPTPSPPKLSTSTHPDPPSSSLIALPSMSHSLSSLPTMTGLPDMLHYGTLGAAATRSLSEAKLDSALRRPRKVDTHQGTHPPNQFVSRWSSGIIAKFMTVHSIIHNHAGNLQVMTVEARLCSALNATTMTTRQKIQIQRRSKNFKETSCDIAIGVNG